MLEGWEEYLFLSKEWIYALTRAIEEAKREDAEFGELTKGFTLTVKYVITGLPKELREMYGSDKVVVYIKLVEGVLKRLSIGPQAEETEADFTVESRYEVAKALFSGRLNLGSAFVGRKIEVSPLRKLYLNPKFAAKSVVTANAILKIAAKMPTRFPDSD